MSMELAKNLYAKMPDVFAKARKKFGRGLTLSEKVLVSSWNNLTPRRGSVERQAGAASGSCRDAGRDGPNGHIAVHAGQQEASGRPEHHSL